MKIWILFIHKEWSFSWALHIIRLKMKLKAKTSIKYTNLIPQWLFNDRKECLIRLTFTTADEKFIKSFINRLEIFTNYRVKFNIVWANQRINSLFNNKDKVSHYSCVIYRGICSCVAGCIENTVHSTRLRWYEHENGTDKNSECAKRLNENDNHEFSWSILSLPPKILFERKIFEAYFIKTFNLVLKNQLNTDILQLFRNDVTQFQLPNVYFNSNFLIFLLNLYIW